jgi:adenylylsulfate kinase
VMVVVWLTGLPAAGKSLLAERAAEALRARGRSAVVLDSDVVRDALGREAGRGEAERDAFYDALARLAALVAAQGVAVLVPATAHKARYRRRARELAPRFVEVYVDTPVATCRARDPKGLYARAPDELPGAGVTYEAPPEPDVVAHGGADDAARDAIVARVLG